MLRFFRKIRKRLFNEGQVSKYLAYSIGEILLVVIGILIALQINVWKENGQERRLEKSTLLEINNSLKSDIQNFEAQIKTQMKVAAVSKDLLDHITAKKEYATKLDTMWETAVRYYIIRFNNSAFNLLESRGIDLISNVFLRNQIVDHYNFEQVNMQRQSDIAQKVSDQTMAYFFDRLYPQVTDDFAKSFHYKKELLIPTNYQAILDDPTIIAKLSHSIKIRYRLSQLIREYMKKERKLSATIEKELDKMD